MDQDPQRLIIVLPPHVRLVEAAEEDGLEADGACLGVVLDGVRPGLLLAFGPVRNRRVSSETRNSKSAAFGLTCVPSKLPSDTLCCNTWS